MYIFVSPLYCMEFALWNCDRLDRVTYFYATVWIFCDRLDGGLCQIIYSEIRNPMCRSWGYFLLRKDFFRFVTSASINECGESVARRSKVSPAPFYIVSPAAVGTIKYSSDMHVSHSFWHVPFPQFTCRSCECRRWRQAFKLAVCSGRSRIWV